MDFHPDFHLKEKKCGVLEVTLVATLKTVAFEEVRLSRLALSAWKSLKKTEVHPNSQWFTCTYYQLPEIYSSWLYGTHGLCNVQFTAVAFRWMIRVFAFESSQWRTMDTATSRTSREGTMNVERKKGRNVQTIQFFWECTLHVNNLPTRDTIEQTINNSQSSSKFTWASRSSSKFPLVDLDCLPRMRMLQLEKRPSSSPC